MTFSKTDEKYQILETHLKRDQFLLVHLNPSTPGVIVPENLIATPTLTLKLSYNFQGLTVLSKELVTAELMFNGKLFECHIPLEAIWGCTTNDQKNYIWPESLSGDSYTNLASEMESMKKPKLAVNKNVSGTDNDTAVSETEETAPKRPNLTRIK